jgi:hypothetical protein
MEINKVKFEKTFVSREHRYSLGVETTSGLHYVAIPVSNQLIDYMESYKLTNDEYESFSSDPTEAMKFVESCRRREHDDRLFMQPGRDRGVPR